MPAHIASKQETRQGTRIDSRIPGAQPLHSHRFRFSCILLAMAFPAKPAPLLLAALLAVTGLARAAGQAQPAQIQPQPTPVLVELFTSEGCSDCPPADDLLGQLDSRQPIAGVDAIVLSEHVTYWNQDGWRDPFSFDQMTDRQQEYARDFGLSDTYTPQMVVDGAVQFVGNDAGKLTAALTHAAASPKIPLTIADAHQTADGSIAFSVRADDAKSTLIAAVAENATVSEVLRGENKGRTLHHVAVVRVLKEFGSGKADGRPLALSGSNLAAAEKTGTPLRLVVFLVNRHNDHVVGVAEQTLNSSPSASTEQTQK
jgi:hypothetical protein